MKIIFAVALLFFSTLNSASAETVYRIEVGSESKKYSDSEMRRRIWELERAVSQLQRRVFELEVSERTEVEKSGNDEWLCTVSARGTDHTGTGGSKAVATDRAMKECKRANNGDGFFCNPPKCEK